MIIDIEYRDLFNQLAFAYRWMVLYYFFLTHEDFKNVI